VTGAQGIAMSASLVLLNMLWEDSLSPNGFAVLHGTGASYVGMMSDNYRLCGVFHEGCKSSDAHLRKQPREWDLKQ
jgi:hypothetical protein